MISPSRYFSRFGEHSRQVAYLILISIILNVGFGTIFPYLPFFASELGATPLIVGFIFSGFMMGRSITSYTIGGKSDVIGRKPIILIGMALYGILNILSGFTSGWVPLLVLRVCAGMSAGAVWPIAEALLVDSVPPKRRGEALGLYVTSMNVGFFLGPVFGSGLFLLGVMVFKSKLLGYSLPFFSTSILTFIAMALAYKYVYDPYVKRPEKERKVAESVEAQIYVRRNIYSFYGIEFFFGFAIMLMIPVFALYFVNDLGLPEVLVGIVLALGGFVAVVGNTPFGWLSDRVNKKLLIYAGLSVIIAMGALFGFAGSLLGISLLFIIWSIGEAALFPALRSLQANLIPPKIRGRIMGRIQASFNIGGIFGPIIGGYVYSLFSGARYDLFNFVYFGGAIPFGFMSILLFLAIVMTTLVDENR